ncbi:MAG: DUF1016 N-terminal domain-containing protein, partial [Thermoplasmata archaeon]|nr:DUF1016 N-terminal domain-containing protein [Thermoplasmata archaeon]
MNKKTTMTTLPASYVNILENLKERIRTAQVKAILSVNRELVQLYWDIGKAIVERQRTEGWGSTVVECLAEDLSREFPNVSGFSARNIWRMRAFYIAYTVEVEELSQLASEMDGKNLPQAAAEIPWFHNIVLLEKVKNPAERLWYARQTVINGWS